MRKYPLFIFPGLVLIVFLLTPRLTDSAKPSDFGLKEGDTISAVGSNDPDIYIINELGYKRLFLNPVIFSFYGHLGGFANVKNVSPQVRDVFPTSGLFRNCETGDKKVYGLEVSGEDTGLLHWVNVSGEKAVEEDPNFFKKVFCINNNEFNWYGKSYDYTSVKQVPDYSRQPGPTPTSTPTPSGSPSPTPTPGPDTIPPVINSWDVQPRSGSGNETISWNVSDAGGSHVQGIKIDRATYSQAGKCNDTDKSGCVWQMVKVVLAPNNSDNWVSSITDTLFPATYWYKIRVGDYAGNLVDSAYIKVDMPPAPELSVTERINNRIYPSIHQAWSDAENLNLTPQGGVTPLKDIEDYFTTVARHDLFWQWPDWYLFGLKSANSPWPGLATSWTPDSIEYAITVRNHLLYLNPKMLFLAEIHYRDALDPWLPLDSPYWKRDGQGNRIPGWGEGNQQSYLLDYANPAYRQILVDQCKNLINTKVFDGCMFDWWNEKPLEPPERVALIQAMRSAIGEAIIVVNSAETKPVLTAQYINGAYMEGFGVPYYWTDWTQARDILLWLNANLRTPRFTAFEAWFSDPGGSRNEVNKMRMATAMELVFSDGYALFSDPNPGYSWDHLHDWYPFWDKSLGRPIQTGYTQGLGAYGRNYDNGTVAFNPPTNQTITFTFPELRTSKATGIRSQTHTLNAGDGDIYLK